MQPQRSLINHGAAHATACPGRALKVQFNRPDPTRNGAPYFASAVCVDAGGPGAEITTNFNEINSNESLSLVIAYDFEGVHRIELQDVNGDGIADYVFS